MTMRPMLTKWIGEFCAPVVVTVVTAEVESICLKNGMLLHEMLSGFGKLDGANATIRSTSSQIEITDAHIRFERVTEVRPKNAGGLEELLRTSFEEIDLAKAPTNLADLKADPPSTWCSTAEQLMMRSMAFSEMEMLSHPVVLLLVVATTDVDPVACMQELASVHHTPSCLTSGQYDGDSVQRVYLLIHDNQSKIQDPRKEYDKLRGYFPSSHTKFLALNSIPQDRPNLNQPDIWRANIIPLFYPQLAPTAEYGPMPLNTVNGKPALGCYLASEDFVALKEFSGALYHQEILPCLERRIGNLSRLVADARKGVKNVLKNFWRKPREESPSRLGGNGTVRYRYDRIESQILLLADSCFIVKDYEAALNMYKLAKEDFKSDKSMVHLTHATLMAALCHAITEPNKPRDTCMLLEVLNQLVLNLEPAHSSGHFALLASEIYLSISLQINRAAIDASHLLLQAASSASRLNMMSAMLTERASICYLIAGQTRKFAFYQVFCGNKFKHCGPSANKQVVVCFLSAMIIYEKSRWGYIKSYIARSLAAELRERAKTLSPSTPAKQVTTQLRALLLALKAVSVALSDDRHTGCKSAMLEAEPLLADLIKGQSLATSQKNVLMDITENILIHEGWSKSTSHNMVLGDLPLSIAPSTETTTETEKKVGITGDLSSASSAGQKEICGQFVPELDLKSLEILTPINGILGAKDFLDPGIDGVLEDPGPFKFLKRVKNISEELSSFLLLELEWELNRKKMSTLDPSIPESQVQGPRNIPVTSQFESVKSLSENWAELLSALDQTFANSSLTEYTVSAPEPYILHPFHTIKCDDISTLKVSTIENKENSFQIPMGESVILSAKFRNRLSTKINITDLALDFLPRQNFTDSPASLTLFPGGSGCVLIRAQPTLTGTYQIAYLKWSLGMYVRVRHPLRRPGPLLQKTLQNRAGRQRTEDTSLLFEVTSPLPSLTLSLQALSPHTSQSKTHESQLHLLQGQIMESVLTIKNNGFAPATEIYLKFSHPNFVLANLVSQNDGIKNAENKGDICTLIPLYGRSGTVLKLIDLSEKSLLPGDEIKYSIFMKMNDIGKHRISILASYCSTKKSEDNTKLEDLGVSNSGPPSMSGISTASTSKHRTSILTFQVAVLPSMDLSVRSIGCMCASSERTLMLHLSNNLKPPTAARPTVPPGTGSVPKGENKIERNSYEKIWCDSHSTLTPSQSQLRDPPTQSLEEGNCQIEGIWIFGGYVPKQYFSSEKKTTLKTSPSEKVTISLPIYVQKKEVKKSGKKSVLHDINNSENYGNSKWILPISNNNSLIDFGNEKTSTQIENILERFACLNVASTNISKEIHAAKKTKSQQESEDAELGPRSIAQVRRENKNKEQNENENENTDVSGGGNAKMNRMNSGDGDSDKRGGNDDNEDEGEGEGELVDILITSDTQNNKEDDTNTIRNLTDPRSAQSSHTALLNSHTNPSTVNDLTAMNTYQDCVTASVYWVCKVGGNIVRGVHTQTNITTLPESVNEIKNKDKINEKKGNNSPISYQDSSSQKEASDSLSIAIRHPQSLLIPNTKQSKNIEAIILLDIQSNSNQKLLISAEVLDKKNKPSSSDRELSNSEKNQNFLPQRGLRWEKKTNFIDVEISPYGSLTFEFHAVISSIGAYDMNRFKISAKFTDVPKPLENEIIFSSYALPSVKYVSGQSLLEVMEQEENI